VFFFSSLDGEREIELDDDDDDEEEENEVKWESSLFQTDGFVL
jgi:hypothetical protein